MITRRQVLRGCAVAVAAGGTALLFRATEQGVPAVSRGSAYALWRTWDRAGGIEPVVAAGVLAANAHDAQPWRFRVDTYGDVSRSGPGQALIEVRRDPDRDLGAFDPFGREVHASVGCAVENIVVIARARGYEPSVALLPSAGDRTLLASIVLERTAPVGGALADAVPHRRTNRFPYERETALPSFVLRALDAASADLDGVEIRWLTGPDRMRTFRDETWNATEAFIADAEMSRDSHDWFRHSWRELQLEASGLTLDGSVPNRLLAAGAKIAPDLGERAANDVWLSNTRRDVDSAPVAGIIVADPSLAADPTDAPRAWIQAGRLWQRTNLGLTAEGLAAQPLSQLTELADRERRLGRSPRFGTVVADLVGPDGVPMMAFRAGVPTRSATPTPRRPLSRVVTYI